MEKAIGFLSIQSRYTTNYDGGSARPVCDLRDDERDGGISVTVYALEADLFEQCVQMRWRKSRTD